MTSLTAAPTQGNPGAPVVFTARATVVGCTMGSYTWNFGDGSPETVINTGALENTATHTFAAAGIYTVRVTARNGTNDAQGTSELTFTVAAASPTPTTPVTPTTTTTPAPTSTPTLAPTGSSGGSSGGCSAGAPLSASALVLLLTPLLLFPRR